MSKMNEKKLAKPPGVSLAMADLQKQKASMEAEKQQELLDLYAGVESPKPELDCRIFSLPSYCSVSSVAMRELDGHDDIMSSYWADMNADEAMQQSAGAAQVADQREGIRLALVGVDGRQVNSDAPYMECDAWTSKTWRFLMQFFSELNGVPMSDLKNSTRGAVAMRRSENGGSQGPALGEE